MFQWFLHVVFFSTEWEGPGLISNIDKLTGLHDQKYFMARLEEELSRSRRYKRPLTVVLFEINYNYFMPEYNIRWAMVYTLLKQFGALLLRQLRNVDIGGRYGGEMFTVLLPETPLEGAKIATERIRQEVEKHTFIGDNVVEEVRLALNGGMASFPQHGKTPREIISSAHQGLLISRNQGGNKIIVCPHILYNEKGESLLALDPQDLLGDEKTGAKVKDKEPDIMEVIKNGIKSEQALLEERIKKIEANEDDLITETLNEGKESKSLDTQEADLLKDEDLQQTDKPQVEPDELDVVDDDFQKIEKVDSSIIKNEMLDEKNSVESEQAMKNTILKKKTKEDYKPSREPKVIPRIEEKISVKSHSSPPLSTEKPEPVLIERESLEQTKIDKKEEKDSLEAVSQVLDEKPLTSLSAKKGTKLEISDEIFIKNKKYVEKDSHSMVQTVKKSEPAKALEVPARSKETTAPSQDIPAPVKDKAAKDELLSIKIPASGKKSKYKKKKKKRVAQKTESIESKKIMEKDPHKKAEALKTELEETIKKKKA